MTHIVCRAALAYQYDPVGNILGLRNTLAVPPPKQYGGPSKQRFAYDDLYRLTRAEGVYRSAPNKTRSYRLDLTYDSIHNLLSKQQADVLAQPSGQPVAQQKTSYAWTYQYNPSGQTSVRPHAPTHIGDRSYRHDANGNQTGWDSDRNGTRRNIVWDEENRIQSVFDNGHEKFYKYDDAGERVIKRGPQGETVYVNQFFTIRDRSVATKHVWAGSSRLASRLVPGAASGGPPSNGRVNGHAANAANSAAATRAHPGQGLAHRSATADLHAQNTVKNPHYAAGTATGPAGGRDNFLYYFHPDHLGSSNLVTDADGEIFEHLEYFPFGETWVEESSNTQRTPYKFTGKELDEETGLYYFGARYYDPRTSVWQSPDPILEKYLPDGGRPNIVGLGGIYNTRNLGLYGYAHLNPVILSDPDGRSVYTKAAKALYKLYEKGSAAEAFADNVKDVATLFNSAAPTSARFEAFLSLASEALPVSASDVKDAKRAYNSLTHKIDNAGDVAKGAMARGRESEARVLKELGLPKNTQKVTTVEGNAIPDALTSTRSIEIKDTLCVSCTKQIRIQTDAARASGRESVLITGERTHITPQAERAFDRIIKHEDLGP